jgi:uncharacterized protein (TIGR02996 family)
VTSEEDFQRALDEHPDDFQTRLVFADWLQERGDPRAEGYRALGVLRLHPASVQMAVGEFKGTTVWVFGNIRHKGPDRTKIAHALVSLDWFRNTDAGPAGDAWWVRYLSRSSAEDAAALAFSRLSARRRTILLAGPAGTKPKTVKTPTKPRTRKSKKK